ncbi:2500_t:CDS:2 [Rhizophagus irregularis]|nr:2500_t:CDS:2 [Rhizophagus irregularis]
MESKKIGPEFAEKPHLGAIYTSRPLSALISKCSSIYSFSTISIDSHYISELKNNTDVERYNSTELEFDINTESLSLYDLNSTIQNYSTALDSRYVSAELDLDINTESSTLQNYSTALDFRYISTELDLDIKTESFRSQNSSSTIQNFTTSLKKRRNEELLNVETHNDSEYSESVARFLRRFNPIALNMMAADFLLPNRIFPKGWIKHRLTPEDMVKCILLIIRAELPSF